MEEKSYNESLARHCYYVYLGIVVVLFIGMIVLKVLDTTLMELYPYSCSLYSTAKIYCPGCGGTRAFMYLLQGDIIQSLKYHPVVLYTAIYVGSYIISHTLNIFTKGKVKAMLFNPIYFYVMIGIILLQWAIKNILIIVKGIYII